MDHNPSAKTITATITVDETTMHLPEEAFLAALDGELADVRRLLLAMYRVRRSDQNG